MRNFLRKIVFKHLLRKRLSQENEAVEYSAYRFAKGFREVKIITKQLIKDTFLILLGIASAAFGLGWCPV